MKKRFTTIYLHIGLGKTGTSTIQNNLFANKGVLDEKFGILYPTFDLGYQHFLENHNIFIKSLFSKNATKLYHNILYGIDTPEKVATENKKYLKLFEEQLKESTATKMILSAEAITSLDILGCEKMVEWLMNFTDNLKIIASFRHPLDSISSDIQQQVKIGFDLDIMLKPQFANIRHNIQKFKKLIDVEDMIFYSFSEAMNHSKGVFGKFLDMIELPIGDFEIDRQSHFNQSLSMEGTLLLGVLNKHQPVLIESQKQSNKSKQGTLFIKKLKGQKFRVPRGFMERFMSIIKSEDFWLEKTLKIKLNKTSSLNSFPTELTLNKKTISLLSKTSDFSEEFISTQFQVEYLHIGNPAQYPSSKLYKVAMVISEKFSTKIIKT